MTATDSYNLDPGTGGGADTVHSAVHSPGDDTDPAPNARPCTRVREGSGESAQSQPDSAPPVDLNKSPNPVTWSDRIGGAAGVFSPPDIWSQERPSLQQVWAYATRGGWTRPDGVPRRFGQVYAVVVAFPVAAVAYSLAWAAERGSRLVALIVLLVLLAQVPPLSWLI